MSYEKSVMFITNLAYTVYESPILDNNTLYSLKKIGLKKLLSNEVTDMKLSSNQLNVSTTFSKLKSNR